eukprot:scaffold12295_cov58-Attheya_sp.AAC.1
MESLICLVEKRDGTVKVRTCANGSTQIEYIKHEDAASPTASTDLIIITSVINAKQNRDVMTSDVPNAFVQIEIDQSGEKIVMKIRGVLALYRMLVASLLYYKKFVKDIKSIGFILNPYDPCVVNRMIEGKQHTLTWHIDDIKLSHVDSKVNDKFLAWLETNYGEDGIGSVKTTRGKKDDYLAMVLDFSKKGKLVLDMCDYVKGMVKEAVAESLAMSSSPWTEKRFKLDETSPLLATKHREMFHTFVMKGIRTIKPNEGNWNKLVRLMGFLKTTQDDVATLEADDTQSMQGHIDATFTVHGDYKSHTGATLMLGKGTVTSISCKQKINTRSSTESELVGIDDVIAKMLWTKLMIKAQGFKVKNIAHRDNTSSMKLEANFKSSSDKMIGDYMTQPLVGVKFGQKECVG